MREIKEGQRRDYEACAAPTVERERKIKRKGERGEERRGERDLISGTSAAPIATAPSMVLAFATVAVGRERQDKGRKGE